MTTKMTRAIMESMKITDADNADGSDEDNGDEDQDNANEEAMNSEEDNGGLATTDEEMGRTKEKEGSLSQEEKR